MVWKLRRASAINSSGNNFASDGWPPSHLAPPVWAITNYRPADALVLELRQHSHRGGEGDIVAGNSVRHSRRANWSGEPCRQSRRTHGEKGKRCQDRMALSLVRLGFRAIVGSPS